MGFYKDESLNELAGDRNVAQFVSFEPKAGGGLTQRFCRIAGYPSNHQFAAPEEAVSALLKESAALSVNIRSFLPNDPRSKEFLYGLTQLNDIIGNLRRLAKSGLFLIVNETIDVMDGGVSGVVQGGVIEFAPDDTPRCVEKPGTASLPFALGMRLLETVYGFRPDLHPAKEERIEFSIHPRAQGWMRTHTLVWERERGAMGTASAKNSWPNRFSKHIGDKAFGLLMADDLGLPVPRTVVIGRRVAPFSFGRETGSTEVWVRTAPSVPQPGRFSTVKGWVDPFALLTREDPNGEFISSVLCQAAIPAEFSGAAIRGGNGSFIIEGTKGEGDRFMLGLDLPQELPGDVIEKVESTFNELTSAFGPVRFEWVYDGSRVWVVQLHRGATETITGVLVPGDAERWQRIEAALPLEEIRSAVEQLEDGSGLIIVGDIGLTSHIADVVRKAGRPARLERAVAA
ncbi:hypothetical protein [Sinorhizobium fredii]|uniref:Uncharacterized protein n=1 Tax=Rhizobium fredii TaxID=380 RepID=A0A844AFB3_RHIFR|nr:hypothetical protein [Sinorhizobium fredii]MQX10822.1 hypothetical protein [Sinorhizobium fredii]GEC31468.1 hypothetical protein EFR01_16390 [Sinorhizobium fredii]GLS09172.1 hypothetical protein GCM10007864_28020 [Sinorhizobium fredii]